MGKRILNACALVLSAILSVPGAASFAGQTKKTRRGPKPVSTSVLYRLLVEPPGLSYPEGGAGAAGVVRVRLVVASDGAVASTKAISGPMALRKATEDMVKTFVFGATSEPGVTGLVVVAFVKMDDANIVPKLADSKGVPLPPTVTPVRVVSGGEPDDVPSGVPGGEPLNTPPPPPPLEPEREEPLPPGTRRVTGRVLEGAVLRRVAPEYPRLARVAKVSGVVVVEIVVDEDGYVVRARAVSGHPLLLEAAVDAARQWTFRPAKFGGKRTPVVGTVSLTFHP